MFLMLEYCPLDRIYIKAVAGFKRWRNVMKLFNLMESDLSFLKQGLESFAPVMRGSGTDGEPCYHCESVCASGCGATCSDTCGGQGKP